MMRGGRKVVGKMPHSICVVHFVASSCLSTAAQHCLHIILYDAHLSSLTFWWIFLARYPLTATQMGCYNLRSKITVNDALSYI